MPRLLFLPTLLLFVLPPPLILDKFPLPLPFPKFPPPSIPDGNATFSNCSKLIPNLNSPRISSYFWILWWIYLYTNIPYPLKHRQRIILKHPCQFYHIHPINWVILMWVHCLEYFLSHRYHLLDRDVKIVADPFVHVVHYMEI